MNKLTVTELKQGIFNLTEDAPGTAVDAYLVCGSSRALLIDGLQDTTGLYEKVRSLTALPLDVLFTHAHYDHLGSSCEEFYHAGCDIYLNSADNELAEETLGKPVPEGFFRELEDGHTFDLGGRVLRVMTVPGHTPGSVVVLDEAEQLLFSGDSIGSGPIWLQLPYSLPLNIFQSAVERLLQQIKDWDHITIYPGHQNQSEKPLTLRYVEDVIETARLVRSGQLSGEIQMMQFGSEEPFPYAVVRHGAMQGFFYSPGRFEA